MRLTVWYTAIVAIALLITGIATYALIQRIFAARSARSLRETASVVVSASGPAGTSLVENVAQFRASDRRLLLYSPAGALLAESQATPYRGLVATEVFNVSAADSAVVSAVRAQGPTYSGERSRRLVKILPQSEGPSVRLVRWSLDEGRQGSVSDPEAPILLMLGATRDQDFVRGTVLRSLGLASLLTLLVAALSGYFMAGRSLAPVTTIARRAARIGSTNLSERLPVANPGDELGELARVLNDLLDRLQNAFDLQRQFMASAAHELRTPVAVVRAETELAISRVNRSRVDYRDALVSVNNEAVRMSRIVDDLLMLARAESGELPLQRSTFDLVETIEEAVHSLRTEKEQRAMRVELDLPEEMPIEGDRLVLQRVFANLIQNAFRHGGDAGSVEVLGELSDGMYYVWVRDRGAGISPDSIERVFDPFFRDLRARNAPDGGAGLGLAIARSSARAHQGDVVLLFTGPEGTIFEVTLPAGRPAMSALRLLVVDERAENASR